KPPALRTLAEVDAAVGSRTLYADPIALYVLSVPAKAICAIQRSVPSRLEILLLAISIAAPCIAMARSGAGERTSLARAAPAQEPHKSRARPKSGLIWIGHGSRRGRRTVAAFDKTVTSIAGEAIALVSSGSKTLIPPRSSELPRWSGQGSRPCRQ